MHKYEWGPGGDKVLSWDQAYRIELEARSPGTYLQDWEPDRHGETSEMLRLRGLILTQSTEMELGLAQVLRLLVPEVDTTSLTAGALVNRVREALSRTGYAGISDVDNLQEDLELMKSAVRKRNAVAHDLIDVGFAQVGPGAPLEAVLTTLGGQDYDERALLEDLSLLRAATIAAARLFFMVLDDNAHDG